MVKGLDTFREYFRDYTDNYIIIGGTACNELIEDVGLKPRTTKDIDAILIVEAFSDAFVTRFWKFIREGKYELWETLSGKTQFYRFIKPQTDGFPLQIELFSKVPDMIDHDKCFAFIKENVVSSNAKQIIVVSHHVPSFQLSSPDFAGSPINGAFTVELEEYIKASPISYWIYGHSHRNIDKQIGNTQCVSNQLGYVFHHEHLTFHPAKIIEM